MRIAVLLLFLAIPLSAQEMIFCTPSGRASDPCTAPAQWKYEGAPVPFNAPVKYGGPWLSETGRVKGWIWVKAGEPSRPCTAKEDNSYVAFKQYNPCRVKVGEPLFITIPFRYKAVRTTFLKE